MSLHALSRWLRVRSHRHERVRVPVYKFQETRICMYSNGGRSHWYEFCTSTGYQWIPLVRAVSVQVVFLSNPYEVNNTKFVLIIFVQVMTHIRRPKLCHCLTVLYQGCEISKIINDVVEYCYFFRKAFTRFDFTGNCQLTCVESCASTSDRERSTRAGEACTSDGQPVNGNPDSDSYSYSRSCLRERSLKDAALQQQQQQQQQQQHQKSALTACCRLTATAQRHLEFFATSRAALS